MSSKASLQQEEEAAAGAKEEAQSEEESCFLDLSVCRDPLFWLVSGTVMCMSTGFPHVMFFLPNFVRSTTGDGSLNPATLLSITAVSDLVGRFVCGVLVDVIDTVPTHAVYGATLALTSVSVLALPSAGGDVASLVTVGLMYGLGTGCWFLMVPVLLTEYFGVERLGSCYGLVRLMQAVSNLAGPLIAGAIIDATGTFSYAFVIIGVIVGIGSLLTLLVPILIRRRTNSIVDTAPK